jgi:NAD(P)-dependent dehydrogenase (short-subunit alcohol dehydrogenase family)
MPSQRRRVTASCAQSLAVTASLGPDDHRHELGDGYHALPMLPDDSATKGAINAFTKALGQKLIERGIRVNAVAPGPVWTPLNPSDAGLPAVEVATFGQKNPTGPPAQPEELAPAYVFLASDADSSYITGTVLQVMRGETTGG